MRGTRRIALLCLPTALGLLLATSANAFVFTPDALNFGKQRVGTNSETQRVTARGQCPDIDVDPGPGIIFAPGPCEATDIAISGQFEIASSSCVRADLTLICQVDVRFTPRNRGTQLGFLRIASDPVEGVPLEGRGCVPRGKARRLRAKGKKVGKKNVCPSRKRKKK